VGAEQIQQNVHEGPLPLEARFYSKAPWAPGQILVETSRYRATSSIKPRPATRINRAVAQAGVKTSVAGFSVQLAKQGSSVRRAAPGRVG